MLSPPVLSLSLPLSLSLASSFSFPLSGACALSFRIQTPSKSIHVAFCLIVAPMHLCVRECA